MALLIRSLAYSIKNKDFFNIKLTKMKNLTILLVMFFVAGTYFVSAQSPNVASKDNAVKPAAVQGTLTPVTIDPDAIKTSTSDDGTATKTTNKTITYKTYGSGRCGGYNKSTKVSSSSHNCKSHSGSCCHGKASSTKASTTTTKKNKSTGPF